jgi:Asp-tRNA(Asn)/Glu-tRNA(Gln) amidotransferase C subunit
VFYDVEKAEADARAQFKEEEERKHKDTVEAIEDLVGQVSMLY